jgi:hypothetical protein
MRQVHSTVRPTVGSTPRKNSAGLTCRHRRINHLESSGGGTRTPDTRIMIMPRRADSSGLIVTSREETRRYRTGTTHRFPTESH